MTMCQQFHRLKHRLSAEFMKLKPTSHMEIKLSKTTIKNDIENLQMVCQINVLCRNKYIYLNNYVIMLDVKSGERNRTMTASLTSFVAEALKTDIPATVHGLPHRVNVSYGSNVF